MVGGVNSGQEDILRHLWNQAVARSTSRSVLELGAQPRGGLGEKEIEWLPV